MMRKSENSDKIIRRMCMLFRRALVRYNSTHNNLQASASLRHHTAAK